MTTSTLAIVKFCAEEVERQGRGPIQVWNMVEAWSYAQEQRLRSKKIDLDVIQMVGHLIEPAANKPGAWRHIQVYVGRHVPAPPEDLQGWMQSWLTSMKEFTPEESYRRFQEIHPFVDGNGRAGKVIYNWLKGTLALPEMPPNFFGCANP